MKIRVPSWKLALFASAAFFALAIAGTSFVSAQSSATEDWEKAAGGKMSFDVASVRQNGAGANTMPTSNVPLFQDAYPQNGGMLSAKNWPLASYIMFAYKRSGWPKLPTELGSERFDIEARAPEGTTKDQMRLMMQSLLADRFKLSVHFETNEQPVYALVLVKQGITGPRLQPHKDDPPCPDPATPAMDRAGLVTTASGFPSVCGETIGFLNGTFGGYTGRDVTTEEIAASMRTVPNGWVDRPVVDRTGLTGKFDFLVRFTNRPPNAIPADDPEATYFEALKEQLGLKLESTVAPIETLVVDHVEQPSPN